MALGLTLPELEARPPHPPETRPARVQPWLELVGKSEGWVPGEVSLPRSLVLRAGVSARLF